MKEGKTHSLEFKETVEEDEGLYKCTATNFHGEASCSAKFTITEEAVKPEFKQKMKHVEIGETNEAKFEVEVTGTPQPDVKWLRKKEELKESEKYRMVKEGVVESLLVRDCRVDDAGVFQAVAENSAGKVSCNAQLTVTKKLAAPTIVAPKDLPSTFELKYGERLSIEFAIDGEVAEKYWMKNGEIIEGNERIKIVDENEKSKLVIEMAEENDSGSYEFTVSNSGGKTLHGITLRVEGLFKCKFSFASNLIKIFLSLAFNLLPCNAVP